MVEAVRKANLHLHPKTRIFAVPVAKYLGRMLTRQGISCVLDKVAAMDAIPVPQSLVELQRFMGKCHYRKFLRNFSSLAAPLFGNTSKKTAWVWTP